jgi:hypothetical protein
VRRRLWSLLPVLREKVRMRAREKIVLMIADTSRETAAAVS